MAVEMKVWLDLIEKEYLTDFIINGGAAVKFAVADDVTIGLLEEGFSCLAADHGLVVASVSSADVKLHMMQDVFFAISRQIDWEADSQRFVEGLFQREGYPWPATGEPVALKEIADLHNVDVIILRREFHRWLTGALMRDTSMAQDFRIAITQLCQDRLGIAPVHGGEVVAPILQWLRGELRLLSTLKSATIYSKITRHNARAMLRSLCRWLALAGHNGLFVSLDIRQLTRTVGTMDGLRYTSGAVMDAYEVLRQLVDDADLFERFFLVVIGDFAFVGNDRKRSVDAYTALKMRIWDDVRAREQDNPLAPMVVIEANR